MRNNKLKFKTGFTLIETLVAITILSAAVAGPMVLSIKNIGTASVSQDQLVAFYLGQEVFEYARNVRDTNLINDSADWLDGLENCETVYGCSVDFYNSYVRLGTGYSANAATLDQYTKVLFPFDTDTQFTDKSGNNNSVNSIDSGIYISTSNKKFGDGSSYFSGGDWAKLALLNSSDLNFSSDKFTIDFWLNFDDFVEGKKTEFIFEKYSNAGNFITFYKSLNDALVFRVHKNDNQIVHYYTKKNDFHKVKGWHHYAVVRDGSDFKIFLDGASLPLEVHSGRVIGSQDITTNDRFLIGSSGYYRGSFKGYMDEFRLSKEIARWSGNFSVPATTLSDTDNSDGITAKTVSQTAIDLSWLSLGANVLYKIFRGTDGVNYSQIYSTGATSYSDTGLSPDTRYYYKIYADNILYGSNESLAAQACGNSGCPNLNFNESSKQYNHMTESENNKRTIFNRNVKISKLGDGNEAKIDVTIKWTGKYGGKTMNLQDNIFNWR